MGLGLGWDEPGLGLGTGFCVCVLCGQLLSCVQLFAVPWTIQLAKPVCSWNFPGKNTGGGVISSLGDLLDPGVQPVPLASISCAGRQILLPLVPPGKWAVASGWAKTGLPHRDQIENTLAGE